MLNCSDTYVQKIPALPVLEYLNCCRCPFLTFIPRMPFLISINCQNCKMILFIPKVKGGINCNGCPWVNHLLNTDFSNNIKKLIKLQKNIRKYILNNATNTRAEGHPV